MSKSIPKKLEWLVLIYDKRINQRLKVRAQHLREVPEKSALGILTSGGGLFKDETKKEFVGSALTVQAESAQAALDYLKKDIYATEGVWDFDNVVIHPYAPIFRHGVDLPKQE